MSNGALLHTLTANGHHVSSVAWSPDGMRVLTSEEGYGDNVRLWDADSGAPVITLAGDPNGFVQSVA